MYKNRKSVDSYDLWLDEFLEEKQAQGLSQPSLKSYQFSVSKYLKFVDVVDRASFFSFVNNLQVAPTSKQHYARDIRSFLYWCMDNQYISRFKVSLPKGQEPTPKIISKEDVDQLLKKRRHCFAEDRIYAVICLILSTGLRCRSIVNLTVDDVDFENKVLTVKEVKNKKPLYLPLTDKVLKILKHYIKSYKVDGYLFPCEDGSKMKSESLQSAYNRYAEARNVPYGIHSLRHYFATECTRNGMSPFTLQKILGHSDISITMKYVNLVNDDVRRELDNYCAF